ncbi:MAG TPA: recombinase family protein [Myxococcales bacterium]
MGCIAYLRVSKKDGRQTVENQRPDIEALAAARGLAIDEVFEDRESACRRRPGLSRMLTALRAGKLGPAPVLVIWSLDRLGRGLSCFDTYRELTRLGVRVLSAREPWLDADGPARELLVAVMSWVSGFERTRLIERTKAGLERAKRHGRVPGRPRANIDASAARALRADGLSIQAIADRLRCSPSSLHRLLSACPGHPEMGPRNEALQAGGMTRVG